MNCTTKLLSKGTREGVFCYNVCMDNASMDSKTNMERRGGVGFYVSLVGLCFLIGLLDVICTAMPSWAVFALTTWGFGLIFVWPISLLIYILPCYFNQSRALAVQFLGRPLHMVLRILSFFIGWVVSFGFVWILPSSSITYDSSVVPTVITYFAICTFGLVVVDWMVRRFTVRWLRG